MLCVHCVDAWSHSDFWIVFDCSRKSKSASSSDDTSDNGFDSDSRSESEFDIGVELIDQQLESPSWTFNLPNVNVDDREKLINKLKQTDPDTRKGSSKHEMIDWIKKLNKREKIDAKSNKRALLYQLKAVLAPFAVRIDSNKCKDNENDNDFP